MTRLLVVLLAAMLAVGIPFTGKKDRGPADKPSSDQQRTLDQVSAWLNDGQVSRVRIYYLAPPAASVQPAELEDQANYVVDIREIRAGTVGKELPRQLDGLIADTWKEQRYPVRWGLEFLDAKGRSYAWIYLNDEADVGAVGQVSVRFRHSKLREWLNRRFSRVLQ